MRTDSSGPRAIRSQRARAAQRVNDVAMPLIRRISPRGMKPAVVTSALYCTPGMDRARPRAASRSPSAATSSADSQAMAG